MATAIFYASDTGNTEDVAKIIAKELGDIEIFDITNTPMEKINEYDKLIFGAATWGSGDLSDEWESIIDDFNTIDFTGKTVAIFGLGDQDSYGDTYVDAMAIIYEQVKKMGGNVVGNFAIDSDYYYDESEAIIDGKFVGLALDEDNQHELTDKRIKIWTKQIKNQIL